MIDKAVATVKRLAESVPHQLILAVLVCTFLWAFLGHLERVEAKRSEVLSAIGAACHLHQEKTTHDVTLALEAQTKSSWEVSRLLIQIRTLLETGVFIGIPCKED